MDSLQIRETFLEFFEERDHRRYESAPLIPNDPSLLLTIAGMVPFKPYFLGDAEPPTPRATSYQKCVRTNDIDNVGRTRRHMSFFEMLGNFSFGDYFKREAIRWAWQLSTDALGLDPDRIWVTIFTDDDDAEALWLEESDVPAERIQRRGKEDNFWSVGGGAGPCGPCSEMYYDLGSAWGEDGGPTVDEERFLEYYNLVFMENLQDEDGNVLGELPAQNVDTGLGLERMARIKQGVDSVFDTDWLRPMVDRAADLTGVAYGDAEPTDVSLRVIAEHARTAAFLIADGVLPAKEGRGYVLRRLLRRAVRHGHLLDFYSDGSSGGAGSTGDADLVQPMIEQVIETMGSGYPELERQRELVTRVAGAEESDFRSRLRQGLSMLDDVIADVEEADAGQVPGEIAFKLHDTYGFPVDLTAEIAEDAGLSIGRDEFDRLMQEQRERARAAAKDGTGETPVEIYREVAGTVGATAFVGYDTLTTDSAVGAIVTPGGALEAAQEGEEVEIVLPRTPFYAEGGGQVGDRGTVETDTGRLEVTDTVEAIEGLYVHRATVVAGEVLRGQPAEAAVDPDHRTATARSHSATHVLHATIREILGDHAQQAGSLVEPGRLRFDFPHFEQVPDDALREIEETINQRVLRDPAVTSETMDIDAARAAGAMANFEEKYGQRVRVVTIGDFSKELCGGTHVGSGATIGSILVVREESIGANTRRIEALTGADAYHHAWQERFVAEEVARMLGTRTEEVVGRVRALTDRLKEVEKELEQARQAELSRRAAELAGAVQRRDGYAVVTREVDVADMDELRQLALELRGQLQERAVVVLGLRTADGKAQLIAALTADLVDAGVEVRPILHAAAEVVGGGAGGGGDLAQAGGREGDRLHEALETAAGEAERAVEAL